MIARPLKLKDEQSKCGEKISRLWVFVANKILVSSIEVFLFVLAHLSIYPPVLKQLNISY